MKKELSVLKIENLNKSVLSEIVAEAVDAVVEHGRFNVMDVYAKATALEFIAKNVKAGLKNDMAGELIGEKQSTITRQGIRVTLSERKNYDYSHCQAWKNAKEELQRIEKLMKATEKPIVDSETGEIIDPARVKYITQSAGCELPK